MKTISVTINNLKSTLINFCKIKTNFPIHFKMNFRFYFDCRLYALLKLQLQFEATVGMADKMEKRLKENASSWSSPNTKFLV